MIYLKRILYFFCSNCRPNKSRTVRFAFPLAFVAASLLGAAALLHEGKSYIRVESSTQSVTAGQTFEIKVFAGAHVPVNAVDIAVSFPKNQIKINTIDTGESVITIWTQDPYVEGNKVIMRGGTFRKGFLGEHEIATINATAIESGKAEFSVADHMLLAGDGSGSEVAVSTAGNESVTLFVSNTDGTIGGNVEVSISTDINGDGDVGLDDVASFMSAWRDKDQFYDFNKDRKMNFTDFAIILSDSFFK